MRFLLLVLFFTVFFINKVSAQASFTAPDTVCVNAPVNIQNTSLGATTYFWNFCTGSLYENPTMTSLGNLGVVNQPSFMTLAQDGNQLYAFVINYITNSLVRLSYGTSYLNTPVAQDFGTFSGKIPTYTEGVQVVKDATGNWHVIIVGGAYVNIASVMKVDFGNSLANNSPTAVNWGNIGSLQYPTGLYVFQEAGIWYGITVNFFGNTVTRFTFGLDFSGTPTGVNLGTFAGMNNPTGIRPIKENGNWYLFVPNDGSSELTRLDFGSSLLNTPTGVNLGNPNNTLTGPRDLTIIHDCGGIFAMVVNHYNSDLVKLDFGNDILSVPTGVSLGNTGNMDFPCSITNLFREGNGLYAFVANNTNSTITRMEFNACTASSLGTSTAAVVPAFSYNAPGTYAVHLAVDEGLLTPSTYCKEIVVMPPVVTNLGNDTTICAGQSVTLDAGTSGNRYLWNTGATTQTITVNASGKYYVDVTNGGCKSTDTINVTVAPRVVVNLGNDTTVCFGQSLPLDAGTAGNKYLWNTGATTRTITATAAGKYYVTVSNGNCKATDTINVKIATLLNLNQPVVTNISCLNATGSIAMHPTGGARPYHYYLNGVDRMQDSVFTSLVKGNYIVRLVDSLGCATSATYQIAVIPPPVVKLGADTTVCAGTVLTLNAGAGFKTYLWNTGAVTQTIKVTASGNYSVMVTDSICPGYDTIKVTVSAPMNLNTPVVTDIDCKHTSGSIEMHPAGGTRPYHYYLNGVDRAQDSLFTSLTDGRYVVRVVDSTGCEISGTYKIVTISPIVVKLGGDTTVCAGTVLTLNAGVGYVSYLWNTGDATQTLSVNTSGTYSVEVSDGNCLGHDTVKVTVADPVSLNTPVITNIDCGVPYGQIEVHPTGGTRPYTYYINNVVSKDSVFRNLVVSSYTIRVVDAIKCEASQTYNIVENTAGIIRATGNGTSPTCNGINDGTITVQVYKGTAPFEYAIAGQAYQNSASFPGLGEGTYKVYIRNAVCIDSVMVTLTSPVAFKVTVIPVDEICERGNGKVTISAQGGTIPYSYYWNNVLQTSNVVTDLSTGTYDLQVVDAHNCKVDTSIGIYNVIIPPVTITNHDTTVNIGDEFQLHAINGTDYLWTPADGLSCIDCSSPFAKPLAPVTYIVKTLTGLNCIPSDTITVHLTYNRSLYAPNAFSPNGDGVNDVFHVKGKGVAIFSMMIYNRWGQLIYKTNDINKGWDGRYQHELQPAGGTYVYMVQYAFYGDEKTMLMQKGVFTLIR